MRLYLVAVLMMSAFTGAVPVNANGTSSPGPDVRIEDVTRFYEVYDAANGQPSEQQLQRDYIEKGTEGLRTFMGLRGTTASRIAEAVAEQPQLYVGARRCAAVLPSARRRLRHVLVRLRDLYPAASFPPVTVVIGRGRPIGVGSPVSGLQIGLEALCGVTYSDADPEDRFVHIIAHEYAHVQQPREVVDDQNPTVLEGSLVEGAAEFVAELTSGGVSFAQQDATLRGHELEIDGQFMTDMNTRDLSKWLYNGSMTQAGNIGYWVGYRIVRSYYEHAKDKHLAIREIIEMRDPESFLAQSGWHPGKRLHAAAVAAYYNSSSSRNRRGVAPISKKFTLARTNIGKVARPEMPGIL